MSETYQIYRIYNILREKKLGISPFGRVKKGVREDLRNLVTVV